jgi:hypothetical protein
MSRAIDLRDTEVVVRYDGLSAAATVQREVRVPYSTIEQVAVGLFELPGPLTFRVGTSTAPFGDTRRGTFWVGRDRWFLDLAHRARAVVLDLRGHRYARVALEADEPERLAERIRERLGSG